MGSFVLLFLCEMFVLKRSVELFNMEKQYGFASTGSSMHMLLCMGKKAGMRVHTPQAYNLG